MAVQTIYSGGMGPNPGDSLQIAAVKLVAWLSELTSGMAVQQIYPVMTANPGDSLQISLVKAVAHLAAYAGEGGGGSSEFFTFAAGAPPEDGSITTQGYWNTTDDTKYANTAWPDTAAPVWESM